MLYFIRLIDILEDNVYGRVLIEPIGSQRTIEKVLKIKFLWRRSEKYEKFRVFFFLQYIILLVSCVRVM